jgi:predicted lipid carrier protein YhbT
VAALHTIEYPDGIPDPERLDLAQAFASSRNRFVRESRHWSRGRRMTETPMPNDLPLPVRRVLRWLPPPERLAAPLRLLPEPLLRLGSQQLIEQVLAAPLEEGRLDEFVGRRIGVEATDLGLRWVVSIGDRRVEVLESATDAEATVRGTATDLLLLSSRLEDADTLFFHRRLQLTGDVELGLALRNLLDQLPWESIPLALRIALNRGARFARYARAAYRGTEA